MNESLDAGQEGLWAELFATQMTVLALIETHPDRVSLLRVFDAMVTNLQLYGAEHAGVPLTQTLMHDAIQCFRSKISSD